MNVTVGQLVDWIIEHRRGKAFLNYDKELIQREICDAIKNGVFAYKEIHGEIYGVVCGVKDVNSRMVHIYDILCVKAGVLNNFMDLFISKYPGWILTGMRRDKFMIYDTNKLSKKLTKR